MASKPEPVSSDPCTALEKVENESIEQVKTIEKKAIADDESPGLDVTSSGPEQTADEDENQVVVSNVVPEVDKGDVSVSELTDGDGIKNEAVNNDLEKPKEEPLNTVAKEEEVQVEDSSEKIEVPESVHEVSNVEFEQSEALIPKEQVVTEVIDDVGKNEDFSEEKARVIEELQKESAEAEAAEKDKVESKSELEPIGIDEVERKSELEPIGIDEVESKSELEPIGIDEVESKSEAHVEQKDRDFPPEADEKLDTESSGTKKLAVDEENEVKKEDIVVNEESAMGISDVAETEQTSREIALPIDLATADKDIEAEKKGDAEDPYNISEAEEKAAENIDAKYPMDVETEDKEENAVVNDESAVPEAKGIKEETNKSESKTQVNEAKDNLEEIEPSESLNDAAKESSEKIEIPESVPEASIVEFEAEVIEAKDLGANEATNEGLSDEITNELKKESAETDVTDKIEVDAAKVEESQADKVEGFELKSEAVLEPIIATDESNVEQNDTNFPHEVDENIDTKELAMDVENEDKKEDTVLEAKGNSDVSKAEPTFRQVELPTDIEGNKDETLVTTVKNDKDIEVEKKLDAQESKELVETESTEKIDTDAAKDEAFLTEHKDTEAPTSEAEQNIDTELEDPIKTEQENNSIETSATDVENEEKKEDAVVNDESAVKITEETFSLLPTTQDSDDVSKVEHTSREIQLPTDLESKKDETLAATEKYVEIEKNVDVEEEPQESQTGTKEAPIEEPDDVKATEEAPKEEEAAPVKQKQSNNLLSKMKQSLVKAKKAIIKKAPTKTPPTA